METVDFYFEQEKDELYFTEGLFIIYSYAANVS